MLLPHISTLMLQYLHFSPELALLSSPCNSFIQLYAGWKVSQCSSGKNLIMENNLMLVNNVKQAALNCPGPAGFIIPSNFNYFLRKQLGGSLLSLLSNPIIQIANVGATCNSLLCTHSQASLLFFSHLSRVMAPLEFLKHRSYEQSMD